MARYTGPKNRIARKFGANIFGRLRNPLIHKPNPPGMHGARRRKKSDFGLQLEEKQKLKAVYGMVSEKQLLRYFREATAQKGGNTAHLLLQRLECRLDTIVYRMNLATTPFHAQQLISHGHILVNGKKVDVRSFLVQPGMKISIKEKAKSNPLVKQAVEVSSREIPEYVSFDPKTFTGELLAVPEFEQISLPLPINIALVCEFLAHTH